MSRGSNTSQPSSLSPIKLFGVALILIGVWGTAFTMISVGVRYFSPIWLVALRCMIGAACVSAYMMFRGHQWPGFRDSRWLWYAALGFSGIVFPFFLTAQGQLVVDSGISAILISSMPLMTIILAHFFANESLNRYKSLGFLVGFLGIIMLFLPDKFDLSLVKHWGAQILLLTAAFCYAVTTVAAKRAPDTPSSVGAAMMLVSAAAMAVIAGLFLGGMNWQVPLKGWLMVIGLGVGSTAIGTILYLYVIDQAGPTVVGQINYLPPIVAVIAGVWILGEPLTWRIILACMVIILGIMISRIKASLPADSMSQKASLFD